MKRKIALGVVAFSLAVGGAFAMKNSPSNPELRHFSGKNIAVIAGGREFAVHLYDNATANDLYAKLPMTLYVENYPGYDEKVIRLEQKLSMQGAPKGDEPGIPEVGYYAPGNWIALYYGHIGYWSGKVPLGTIDASTDEIGSIEPGEIRIEAR